MATIVEQLQIDAANPDVSVATLLRRAKIAASKLKLDQLEQWMENELSGYKNIRTKVPAYRVAHGQLRGYNPYNGWIPIHGDARLMEKLCRVECRESVSQIEQIIARSDGGYARVPLNSAKVAYINEGTKVNLPSYEITIGLTVLTGIIDQTRNAVLDWTLKLDKAGIIGGEASFNSRDIEKAREVTMITIGSIGSMVGNLGSNNTSGAIETGKINIGEVKNLIEQVYEHKGALETAGANGTLVEKSISELRAETDKPKPTQEVVSGLLGDLRNAVSGAVGNLTASGILYEIGRLMG